MNLRPELTLLDIIKIALEGYTFVRSTPLCDLSFSFVGSDRQLELLWIQRRPHAKISAQVATVGFLADWYGKGAQLTLRFRYLATRRERTFARHGCVASRLPPVAGMNKQLYDRLRVHQWSTSAKLATAVVLRLRARGRKAPTRSLRPMYVP
jgi:hypothetical protein